MHKLIICILIGVCLTFLLLLTPTFSEKFADTSIQTTTPQPTSGINTLADYYKLPEKDRWDCIQNLNYKDSTFSCAKEIEKQQNGQPNQIFWYLDRTLPIKNKNDPWDRWVAYNGSVNLPTNIKSISDYNNTPSNFKWQCKDHQTYTDQSPFSCKDEMDKKTKGLYNGADWYFDYKKFDSKGTNEWNGWTSFVDPTVVTSVNLGSNFNVQNLPNSFTINNAVGKASDTSSFSIGGYNLEATNNSLYMLPNSTQSIPPPPTSTPPPASTPPPTVPVNTNNYKLLSNKDKPSNNIKCYNYKDGNTLNTCEIACNMDEKCRAFTDIKDPTNPKCCTKNVDSLRTVLVNSNNTDLYNKTDKFAFIYSGVPGDPYPYSNRDQAANACNSIGSSLASTAELEDSFKKGADWCQYGWLTDNEKQAFPIQHGGEGCGGGGGNFVKAIIYNSRVPAAANCINK